MRAQGLDALFLTSEKNIRYLTGFHTQIWVSPTRPRYVLLPLEGAPVAIVPEGNAPGFRATSWISDVWTWPAPRPADDGVSLVLEAVRSRVAAGGRIGAEIGPETRLAMPVADFLRIREALPDRTFVDASPALQPLRMVKSPAEVAWIRTSAEIASEGFARLPGYLRPGLTERDVYRAFQRDLIDLGAERVEYLVPVSGPHGYDQINMGPRQRRLEAGDLLIIDVGVTSRGYFCDFDRNFAIGRASEEFRAAYRRVYEATQTGLEAVRPGRTAADVWTAMSKVLDSTAETPIGRMGHGLGLDITEPPSIAPSDHTVLEEGMVLTLEPSLVMPPAEGMARRLMVHEENIVVTREGCELLTQRAALDLPVV
jgi:Xaa-Pro aminopeptidase